MYYLENSAQNQLAIYGFLPNFAYIFKDFVSANQIGKCKPPLKFIMKGKLSSVITKCMVSHVCMWMISQKKSSFFNENDSLI